MHIFMIVGKGATASAYCIPVWFVRSPFQQHYSFILFISYRYPTLYFQQKL